MMGDGWGWEMGWETGGTGVLVFSLVAPVVMAIAFFALRSGKL
jgi:hypothetical protein